MEPTITKPRLGLTDFFFQLGALILLYVSVGTLFSLLFTIIDVAFPRVARSYYYAPSISWPVAMLIVLFPLYVGLSWYLQRRYTKSPEKRDSILRKILVYITLFVSGGVIAGDLITVLYNYLDGQNITTGFLLKVLAVLVISVLIFVYYVTDLRGKLTRSLETIFIVVATLIVIVSIGFGFSVLGSPYTQRMIKIDRQKIEDLQMIQNQIINDWTMKGVLPANLGVLNDTLSGFTVPKDTQLNKDYVYRKTGDTAFTLCATFNKEAVPTEGLTVPAYDYYGNTQNNWKHGVGEVCFDRTIDPSRYPVRPKTNF